MPPSRRRVLERLTTAHNTVVVEQVGRRVDLAVAGATFATWHPTRFLTGYSWDAITAGCLCHPASPPRRVLLLGLAGGTVARQLRRLLPGLRIDAVEIDRDLVDLGTRHLHLAEAGVHVHYDDAYRFLARPGEAYDVVADDLYLSGLDDVERPPVHPDRWIRLLTARLAPGGIALANFVTGDHHDPPYRDARDAFAKHFPATRVVAPPRGYNRILVGGHSLAPVDDVRAAGNAFPRAPDRDLWQRLRFHDRAPGKN